MYGVFHGPKGLKEIAINIHKKTAILERNLTKIGLKQHNKYFFDTLLLDGPTDKIKKIAELNKINFNYINEKQIFYFIKRN